MQRKYVVSVCLFLTGCVPVLSSYYEAYGDGSVRKQRPCSMGITRVLIMSANDGLEIRYYVPASDNEQHTRNLAIVFVVSQGHALQLVGSKLIAYFDGSDQPVVIAVTDTSRSSNKLEIQSVVAGSTIDSRLGKTIYHLGLPIPMKDPKGFSVLLSDAFMDGKGIAIPPVSFIRKMRPHIAVMRQ